MDDLVQKCLQKVRDLRLDALPDSELADCKKRKLIAEVYAHWTQHILCHYISICEYHILALN